MSTKRLALFLGIAFVAVLAFILLAYSGTTEAGEGTRAVGDYQGADTCQGSACHDSNYNGWYETNHARVFDPGMAYYEDWVSRGRPNSCQPCHVAGYNLTTIGGYDPAYPWNDTTNSNNLHLLGIQCENCHGPDPMNNPERTNTSLRMESEICGTCHEGSRHPMYDEWVTSGHAETPPAYVQNLACARCHEATVAAEYLETGQEPTSLPSEPRWQLTCATCHDPHGDENEHQLRQPVQEICGTCHNAHGAEPGDAVHHPMLEMRQGTANVPVPSSQTMSEVYCAQCHMRAYDYNSSLTPRKMSGHDFEPRPEACTDCHDGSSAFYMNVHQAENSIEFWQESTQNNLDHARIELGEAWTAIHQANTYGFDSSTVDIAWSYYNQANFSANFVESDGSMGAHNFEYANSLISFANLKANQVTMLLTPGSVKGQIIDADGNGVAGVQIMIGDTVWATTGSDGSFSFMHAPGSFGLSLVKDGKNHGTVQTSILAAQTSDVGKLSIGAPTTDGGVSSAVETYQLLTLILVVLALILIIVMMLTRGGRSKATTVEQPPVEPPVEKPEESK